MDALLQIVVPELPQIEGLEIHREFYEIDGSEFLREPVIISWRGLELQFDEETPYLKKFLPPGYMDASWTWLKVSDSALDAYDISVKEEIESVGITAFEDFIRSFLSPIDRWIFAFILNYDQIDHVYQVSAEELTERLRANLMRGNVEEGFIAHR